MRAELCGPYPPHLRTFQRFHSSIVKTLVLWSNRKLFLLPCAFANDADSRSNEACFGKSFLLPAFSPGEFQSASLFARAWAINPSESSNLFAKRPDGWQSRPRRQRILSSPDCEWLNRNLGNRGKVSQKADQDPRNVVSSGNGLLFVCCTCFPGLALQFQDPYGRLVTNCRVSLLELLLGFLSSTFAREHTTRNTTPGVRRRGERRGVRESKQGGRRGSVERPAVTMSDFFSRMANDISVAFEKMGSDFNKTTNASKRKETAGKTGIVSEREAGWSSFPEYVTGLGPKVRSINCERNSIASLPEDVGLKLTSVTKLSLGSNVLTRLPDSLCKMTTLKSLRLEKNKIEHVPDAIGDLVRLEELVLSDNRVRALPKSVGGLTKLTRLDLSRNRLTCEEARDVGGLEHVAGCSRLTELKVDGNVGVEALPSAWGGLTALVSLSADGTRVKSVPAEVFLGCTKLERVSLRGCPTDIDAIRATVGWDEFDARRIKGRDKQIHGGVMLGSMDDGLDKS